VTRWLRSSLAIAFAGLLACSSATAAPAPAAVYSRVVSLAPNLTELVFAAGAGATLVGASAHSDYPPAARELPVVGDAFTVDREQLALLAPDVLLVWQSGTPAHIVDELRRVGFTVEVIRTSSLNDIATALRRVGAMTGHSDEADAAAEHYLTGIDALRRQYADEPTIRVFYQVSQRPLFTVNGQHFVSELIGLCGGRNVFTDLGELAPTVAVEAVIERDPEIMLASDEAGDEAFAEWRRWPTIAANRYRNHFLISADQIGRATPRVVAAGAEVCKALQEGRSRRSATIEASR
jgi:iron complex transport system substrate-binding protein